MVEPNQARGRRTKRPWRERLRRDLRYRLVIPLKRSRHPPEYTARGVAVGTFWALTPTVGVQMAVVLVHWWISRKWLGRDFSVVNAMAWTWITNVFTLLPFYYLFYVTGQFMMGSDDVTGYSGFVKLWDATASSDGGEGTPISELIQTWGALLLKDWFAAMAIGSIPYAFIGGWLAWRWALAAVRAYRGARVRRTERRIAERGHAGHGGDSGGDANTG